MNEQDLYERAMRRVGRLVEALHAARRRLTPNLGPGWYDEDEDDAALSTLRSQLASWKGTAEDAASIADDLRRQLEEARRHFREAEGHRDYWKNREKKRTAALAGQLEEARAELAEWRDVLGRATANRAQSTPESTLEFINDMLAEAAQDEGRITELERERDEWQAQAHQQAARDWRERLECAAKEEPADA